MKGIETDEISNLQIAKVIRETFSQQNKSLNKKFH